MERPSATDPLREHTVALHERNLRLAAFTRDTALEFVFGKKKLAEKYGDRAEAYIGITTAFVISLDNPSEKRTSLMFAKLNAKFAGLSGRDIASARARAKGVYQAWLDGRGMDRAA